MSKVFVGPVFPVHEMDRRQRENLRLELMQLETQLKEHRASLEEWRGFAERALVELDKPAALRERAIRRYAEKKKLVAAGEKLRAILLAELYSQPEYQPGFHYSN